MTKRVSILLMLPATAWLLAEPGCAHDTLHHPSAAAPGDRDTGLGAESAPVDLGAQLDAALAEVTARLRHAEEGTLSEIGPAPEGLAVRLGLVHADAVSAAYSENGQRAIFTEPVGLTRAGEVTLEVLARVYEHGLDPDEFGAQALREAAEALADAPGATRSTLAQDVDREALKGALAAVRPADARGWADALLDGRGGPAAAPVRLAMQRAKEQGERRSSDRWTLELRLADRALAYADVLSGWGRPEAEGGPEVEAWEQARQGRAASLLRELSRRDVDPRAAFEALAPPFEQYERLVRALARYRTFCGAGADGEWPTLGRGPTLSEGKSVKKRSTPGSTGPRVATLRERLRAEGYYQGAPGEHAFDGELADAVRRYQATHQFSETGEVDNKLAASLDVPCVERLAQIAVTLERWRHTRVANPQGRYVQVSIPDFHGEVWEGGQRLHRFRVITGKRNHHTRRDGERVFKFATPEIHSAIKHVVFNPYWNIPDSIRRAEIEPELMKDPGYLDKHNYEIVETPHGGTYIRQRPGPGNALGRVKFLFPNPHDVYLHDTPSKKKFQFPVRAFSHGCVRVHEPMKLAELLLTLDGGWRSGYATMSDRQWVNLRTPIPVHLEYFVVRVDDEGWVHFNADVYRRDEDRLAAWLERYPAGAPSAPPHAVARGRDYDPPEAID